MEVISGVAELRIRADRLALARYGLNVDDLRLVMDSPSAAARSRNSLKVSAVSISCCACPRAIATPPEHFKRILLSAPGGERVALSDVATIELARGPEVVAREDGHRRIVVQANVRGRDMGGFVAEAQRKVATGLALPPGYSLAWGGQFENQRRAMYRLAIVVPASILIIFGLLFATFHSARHALLILLNVPFAMVGGIGALWLRGLNLNVSAVIGLLALFGVAVLNGIVLVSYINQLRQQGKR